MIGTIGRGGRQQSRRNDMFDPEDRQNLPKSCSSEKKEPLPTFVTAVGVRKMRLAREHLSHAGRFVEE